MKRIILSVLAATILLSNTAEAASVTRLWTGKYHFYTASTDEAAYVVNSFGARYEGQPYFQTWDAAPGGFATQDILRCYSPYKQIHSYPQRNWVGGSCEAFGFQSQGVLGKIRLRTGESTPIASFGRPVWSMYRSIGTSPDGTNISDQLITVDPNEAQRYCRRDGFAPDVWTHQQTCFWGYLPG